MTKINDGGAGVDLHELANAPGYGLATRRLQSLGYWKPENAADGQTLMTFKIEVSGTYRPEVETEVVHVTATTKDEAIRKAHDLTNFDEIEGEKIIDVTEVVQ